MSWSVTSGCAGAPAASTPATGAERATRGGSAARSVLAADLVGAVAQAGVDPILEGCALQDALRRPIATRRGACSWTVDHAGSVVRLHSLDEQTVYGKKLEQALAWCLVWLMAKGTPGDRGSELGVGPSLV